MSEKLIIGTRGSALALWQANFVASKIQQIGLHTEIKTFKTTGDLNQNDSLQDLGGKGVFIKELENALLEKKCDLAVHSLKDMPVVIPAEFKLAAVLQRHSPRDLLILNKNAPVELSKLDLVMTSSLRRKCLLKKYAPNARGENIRGNVDTRIEKLLSSDADALILAEASIERLQIKDLRTIPLDENFFVPCAGQGAIVIEARRDFDHSILDSIHCQKTFTEICLEREILRSLGGSCIMPFGCHAKFHETNGYDVHTIVLDQTGLAAETRLQNVRKSPLEIVDLVLNDLKNQNVNKILKKLGVPCIT